MNQTQIEFLINWRKTVSSKIPKFHETKEGNQERAVHRLKCEICGNELQYRAMSTHVSGHLSKKKGNIYQVFTVTDEQKTTIEKGRQETQKLLDQQKSDRGTEFYERFYHVGVRYK